MIILSVYILLLFTPYYGPSPPPWYVVANIMSSFWQVPFRLEGLYFRIRTYTAAGLNQSSGVHRLHVERLVTQGPVVHLWSSAELLT